MIYSFVLKTSYLIHFIMIFLASNYTLIELKHWYWAVFLMSLDSIIFVCKCLVQYDLLRITEAFICKRAWQQKSAEWPVSIVNIMSLIVPTITITVHPWKELRIVWSGYVHRACNVIESFCRILSNIFGKTFIGTEQIPPSPSTTELQTVVVSIRNSITFFQWFLINVIVLCHSVQFHLNCLLSYPITLDTALFQPIIMCSLAFLSSWVIGYKVYEMSFCFLYVVDPPKCRTGADPGFGQGGAQLLRPKVADVMKQTICGWGPEPT